MNPLPLKVTAGHLTAALAFLGIEDHQWVKEVRMDMNWIIVTRARLDDDGKPVRAGSSLVEETVTIAVEWPEPTQIGGGS